jgi:uncharacterized protein (DUF4415 family)
MSERRNEPIGQEQCDDVDSPPLTDEELGHLRPARETHPEIVNRYRRRRGPQKAPRKVVTTLRLDPDVVEYFKSGGRGWQTRLNNALRKAIGKE